MKNLGIGIAVAVAALAWAWVLHERGQQQTAAPATQVAGDTTRSVIDPGMVRKPANPDPGMVRIVENPDPGIKGNGATEN